MVVRFTPRATLIRLPVMFDLDLGETGLLEERRELADQVLVEAAPLFASWVASSSFRHHFDLPAASVAASASIASS